MKGFALLWSKILDSSIWMEDKETRLVWITMLAMKDSEGKVMAAPNALAHRARVSEDECQKALNVFLSPDAQSTSQAEEGRRIRVVPGGWQIINHEHYRFSTDERREFWREQKRKQREAKFGGKGRNKAGRSKAQVRAENESRERRFCAAEERGDNASADSIAAEGL